MAEGARSSRARLRDRLRAWVRHHRLSAADSLYKVLEQPLASCMTWLVIGIALALPSGLNVLLDSAGRLSDSLDSPTQLSLFLVDGVDSEAVGELRRRIESIDGVADTAYMSREDALEEFRELSGFADVLDSLEQNPLPSLVLVEPRPGLDSDAVTALQGELQALPEVAQAVIDLQWLQRLDSLMELARRGVLAVAVVLLLGVVLILGNTLRLAIENRREEIVVTKLIGGSNAFVRRPFLYTGLWYGVGGGAVAALLVSGALWFLGGPVEELAALYQSDFRLRGRGLMEALDLVALGAVLGLAGAWLAVSRHLGEIEPR